MIAIPTFRWLVEDWCMYYLRERWQAIFGDLLVYIYIYIFFLAPALKVAESMRNLTMDNHIVVLMSMDVVFWLLDVQQEESQV